jgi:benzylsuccinate CoA-transferase BbsF subunit
MMYPHLEKLRVIDLGIITAGASTSAILADLGADVIKVEGPAYIDPFRVWTGRGTQTAWWNKSPFFAFTNRNKRGVCIDLKSERGRDILIELVRDSDVLLENFRVGALDKLGLGYEQLSAVNPGLVYASISSQGAEGPEAASVSFGSTLEGSSGLASLIHYDDGVPTISGHALNYPDQVVSLFAASAILCALYQRKSSGRGVRIDVSQRELTSFMIGEALVGGAMSSTYPTRPGAPASLNAVLPSNDGQWVAVTLADTDQVARLRAALGLSDEGSRQLSEGIARISAARIIAAVRAAGGSAELVRRAGDLPDSANGGVAFGTDPQGNKVKGLPWRHGAEPMEVRRTAPNLGQDNKEIATKLLGLGIEEYEALVAAGVFGEAPRSR